MAPVDGAGAPGEAPAAGDVPALAAPVAPVAWAAPALEATPLPDCGYDETDFRIAWCSGRYRNVWELSPTKKAPGCSTHLWRVGTHWYPTQADALGAEQCETACLYRPAAAVMFVRCGHRDEFTEYAAATECPALYSFSDGTLGTSVDQWLKDHPCP